MYPDTDPYQSNSKDGGSFWKIVMQGDNANGFVEAITADKFQHVWRIQYGETKTDTCLTFQINDFQYDKKIRQNDKLMVDATINAVNLFQEIHRIMEERKKIQ